MFRMLSLFLAVPLLFANTAYAQSDDDFDDLDDTASEDELSQARRADVREVVKGFYGKSNVGAAMYLLDFRGFVSTGTAVSLALGNDFVNNQGFSMAWEVAFTQGIHNGMGYEEQGDIGCKIIGAGPAPCVQGDLRTYTFSALLEASIYPSRRIGVGLRAGGGVLVSPLLMDELAYSKDVLPSWGLSEDADPGYHNQPHPTVSFGPTFEYYSKLSHFSVGVDVDAFYAIGLDLGLNGTGYLKYTF